MAHTPSTTTGDLDCEEEECWVMGDGEAGLRSVVARWRLVDGERGGGIDMVKSGFGEPVSSFTCISYEREVRRRYVQVEQG